MKTYTEQEVIELLKKFGSQFTYNVNSDVWYSNWIKEKEPFPNINIYDLELHKGGYILSGVSAQYQKLQAQDKRQERQGQSCRI